MDKPQQSKPLEKMAYVRLSSAAHDKLKQLADTEQRDVSFFIRRAVDEYLARVKS